MILDTKRLHNLACRLAYNQAHHECPEQLAQDLEQAAWVKFLTLESYAHLWSDLYYAMLEELSRWLWQCRRGRGKNRLLTAKVELHEWLPSDLETINPERFLIIKESIKREAYNAQQREYKKKYSRWIRNGKKGRRPVGATRGSTKLPEDLRLQRRREASLRYWRKTGYRGLRKTKVVLVPRTQTLLEQYGVEVVKRALR